jgi:hypothetical protein
VGQVGAGWSTFPVGAVVHPLHYSFPGDLRGEPGARTKRQRIDTSLDVPLVPMECPAKDRYRIMIKCPISAITSAWFCCSQGFPQIGAKAEISTPTLVVSVVLPAARRPVCKPPSHPGIQVRPSGICCPPWSEVEEMSALDKLRYIPVPLGIPHIWVLIRKLNTETDRRTASH